MRIRTNHLSRRFVLLRGSSPLLRPVAQWSYNAGTRAIAMLLFAAEHTREALKSN